MGLWIACAGGGTIVEDPHWNRENPVQNSQFNEHCGNEYYGYACVMRAGGPSTVDDAHWIRENPMAKDQVKPRDKAAEESCDGSSSQQAAAKQHQTHAGGEGADESRNGLCKPKSFVKKVS